MEKMNKMVNEIKSKGIKTIIPNAFTAMRLVGAYKVPKEMLKGNAKEAATIAALCGLSDAVDGKIARKLGADTEFGAKFDQVVDKLFALGLIYPLIKKDPKWSAIVLGELAIAKTNIEKELQGTKVKSSLKGKAKTVVLFTTIAVAYLNEALNTRNPKIEQLLNGLFGASIAMETITLVDYIKKEKTKTLTK